MLPSCLSTTCYRGWGDLLLSTKINTHFFKLINKISPGRVFQPIQISCQDHFFPSVEFLPMEIHYHLNMVVIRYTKTLLKNTIIFLFCKSNKTAIMMKQRFLPTCPDELATRPDAFHLHCVRIKQHCLPRHPQR
jgi:hypothetical protein